MTSPHAGMTVALYVRVSTQDGRQDETLQLPRLREIAAARGYQVYREYTDEASGRDANRPGFQDLMADARLHKFDRILAVKLDRIMRSVVNLDTVLQQLDVYGVALECLDIGLIDTRSPNGRLQVQLIGAIAEWERETISVRTREGMAARKARGQHMGRKRRADIPLQTVAALRDSGESWVQIARELHIAKSTLMDRREEVMAIQRPRTERGTDQVLRTEKEGLI